MNQPTEPGRGGAPEPSLLRGIAAVVPAGLARERLDHLFRRMSRAGLVHPLRHLLERYRAGEQA